MGREQWGHGYHTGIKKGREEIGYAGLFFHFYDENGMENRQGIVRKQVDDERYLVSYFSYLDGALSTGEIISLAENTTFYMTDSEMRKAHIEHIRNGKLPIVDEDKEMAAQLAESFEEFLRS